MNTKYGLVLPNSCLSYVFGETSGNSLAFNHADAVLDKALHVWKHSSNTEPPLVLGGMIDVKSETYVHRGQQTDRLPALVDVHFQDAFGDNFSLHYQDRKLEVSKTMSEYNNSGAVLQFWGDFLPILLHSKNLSPYIHKNLQAIVDVPLPVSVENSLLD